jgi:predicted O-methyltransferase YrrM
MLSNDPSQPFPRGRAPWGVFRRDIAGPSIMTEPEIELLLAALPVDGDFLELGTWCGATAAHVADQRPGLRITCVDLCEFHPLAVSLWQANQRVGMTLFVGSTERFFAFCGPAVYDAALVDCDHAEQSVYKDCRSAAAVLRPRGILLVHDYEELDWPGVKAGADRFCRECGWRITARVDSLVWAERVD